MSTGSFTTPSHNPPTGLSPLGATTSGRFKSVRHVVTFSNRPFPVQTLPDDLLRVYTHLEKKWGEEYALLVVFNMRTAIELHRAWHMTLLTSKILQQVKDKFNLRMTWNLGVLRLIFRFEDGTYELQRKVPYDYDSEYQDLYMKIAVALIEGHINVHDALNFQTEVKHGVHTARSGLFLRDFPGRLVAYPALSSTCAVIFFGGDWVDCYVAAICGLATGIVEYAMVCIGGQAKILIDLLISVATGVIGGLFYRFDGERQCLSAIFLGTLYWFFYGTAFVIGLLEIIAGELETGVTRFIAVSVKTFVLCLGASFGMLMTLQGNSSQMWKEQNENCNTLDLGPWRIPMYLLCSVAALAQYRTPILSYWRGLIVQLAAYEVQYQVLLFLTQERAHDQDNLDTAAANVLGAAAAVVTACALSHFVDFIGRFYYSRLLQRDQCNKSMFSNCMYSLMACTVRVGSFFLIDRKSEIARLTLEKKLKKQVDELNDPRSSRSEILLTSEEENVLLRTIVSAESLNVWAILMPALYQLVPGSMIAKLWFNSIFPPPLMETEVQIAGEVHYTYQIDTAQDNIFSNLMVISTSLALGLIVGFTIVQFWTHFAGLIFSHLRMSDDERGRFCAMHMDKYEDPDSKSNLTPIQEEINESEKLEAIGEEEDADEESNNAQKSSIRQRVIEETATGPDSGDKVEVEKINP